MRSLVRLLLVLPIVTVAAGCSGQQADSELETQITAGDIRTHIRFLADNDLMGRETGTPGEARAANYIADHFEMFGLEPEGDGNSYLQIFTASLSIHGSPQRTDSLPPDNPHRISRNVVGKITGSEHPDRYIVIGAHYDHLGMGGYGSLYKGSEPKIHNGADDNASGTAGVLELAQYFSQPAHRPQKSLVFVAFSGEEFGLLGSGHFVENPPVPLDRVEAMINLDMIGRLNENKLLIFGTGTSQQWSQLVEHANTDSITIAARVSGMGSSDHSSFYNRRIPVLHYFTGTHPDYHRPTDDPRFINYEGEDAVLEHVRRVIVQIDTLAPGRMGFAETPDSSDHDMTLRGVTLGVMAVAAVFTPASVLSMVLLAVPVMAAYGLGLGLLWVYTLGGRRDPRRAPEAD